MLIFQPCFTLPTSDEMIPDQKQRGPARLVNAGGAVEPVQLRRQIGDAVVEHAMPADGVGHRNLDLRGLHR